MKANEDKITRLTVEDIATLRSQSEDLDQLDDEGIRMLRGQMRRLKRDGYSNSEIANITGKSEDVVRLLFRIRQLEM